MHNQRQNSIRSYLVQNLPTLNPDPKTNTQLNLTSPITPAVTNNKQPDDNTSGPITVRFALLRRWPLFYVYVVILEPIKSQSTRTLRPRG